MSEHTEAESTPWESSAGHTGAPPPPQWDAVAPAAPPAPPPTWAARPADGPHEPAPHAHAPHDKLIGTSDPYAAPAFRGGSYRPGGVTGSRYGRTSRAARPAGWQRGQGPGVAFITLATVGTLVTLGILTPAFCLFSLARLRQARRASIAAGEATWAGSVRAWVVAAVVTGVVGVGAWTVAIAYSATHDSSSSGSSSSSSDGAEVPTQYVNLGQSATFSDDVQHHRASVTVGTATFDQAAGTETVQFGVCALSTGIDPLGFATNLVLSTSQSRSVDADIGNGAPELPEAFYHDLPAHRCLQGTLRYSLNVADRPDQIVTEATTPPVAWRLPPTAG